MKNKLLLALICCFISLSLTAQTFNNSYTVNEQTYSSQESMVIDEDGSSVTVHTIREYQNSPVYDARVVKVDDQGNVLWSKQFGLPDTDDRANGICKTDDDGYLIVGVRKDSELGYGCWVFRIDNNGNLMWSRWYSDPNLSVSEGYVATRTYEGNETYMVVGTASQPRRIFAMKMDPNGNLYWSHQYYKPSLVDSKYDYVTSMVEDKERGGYIIAGTEHDYYTTGSSTLDLFTFGIGINGNIIRQYKKYDLDLGDNENNPHIIRDFDNDGFAMAFGTRAGGVQSGTVSFISTMLLKYNLSPIAANLYASPNAYESHANSIYVDPHGYYDLGCFIYDGYEGNPNGVRNASFLRIKPNGNTVNYFRYNLEQDQTCTFMAQDFTGTHENYVLKTDHRANGIWSIGLIRTELNGETDCAEDEPIKKYPSGVHFWKQKYDVYSFAEEAESNVEEWHNEPETIPCDELNFDNSDSPELSILPPVEDILIEPSTINTELRDHELIAYPNLLHKNAANVTLKYLSNMDANLDLLVYNVQGQLIYKTEQIVTNGTNTFSINSINFHSGMNTIVLLQNNQQISSVRVMKL